MAKSAREIAFDCLRAFRRSGTWADQYLKDALAKEPLSRRDAALAAQLVYGVLQNRALIDFYIAAYSSVPFARIEPQVLDILRIGVYQLALLDRIPPHAAVNESVALVRRHAARAAGFANALLRRVAAERGHLPEPGGGREARLAVLTSHPEWLVRRLLTEFGDEAEQILYENNRAPMICARVNPLVTDVAGACKALAEDGVSAAAHPWLPGCITLAETGDIAALSAFRGGCFHVCDPASQLAALALDVRPGMRVLDTCAAPGGKTFLLAGQLAGDGVLQACDIHEHKLARMRRDAARLHISNLELLCRDAREPRPDWDARWDAVLCDVPCSGLGVIRKKPEIRLKAEEEIARLPEIQRAILEQAARFVAPGGALVYSTCTILRCENGQVVADFLEKHPEFARERMALPCPRGENDGEITLLPHRNETDGFFICKLRRRA